MEITQVYAIATAGIFVILVFINVWPYIELSIRVLSIWGSRYLVYPKLIHRHQYLGPWNIASVHLYIFYLAVNVFCISFKAPNIESAGLRAANLLLINLIPVLAGHHLGFLADVLGITIRVYQRLHRAGGIMSVFLLLGHVIAVMTTKTGFPLSAEDNMWGLIVRRFRIPSLDGKERLIY